MLQLIWFTLNLAFTSGTVVFDLFANDNGVWKKGRFALIEVSLANGQKLGHWTQLEPPEDRLIGQWNILCQSSSLQAFEPQTLSGSFYIDVEPDGRITGIFGSQKLSGTIDKAGAASGTAGVGEEAVTWTRTITRLSRKQPLKGRGGFKFQRANHQCFSDGQWWSE